MTNEEQQKHEAAIEAWRQEAMSLIPNSFHVDHPRVRVLHVGEIDAICDLARRAPPQPVSDAYKLPEPEPKPEPRASSLLLKAAKLAAEWLEIFDSTSGGVLRQAIEAEEARGPSEVEQLREQLRQRGVALDSWVHKSESEIEQLRKERDEALARAEKAEAEVDLVSETLDMALDRAEKAARDAEALADRAEKAEVALSTPPQQNHIGSILPLRGWLRRRVEGWISSHEVLEDVVELLVRRELARGPK